MMGMRAIGLVGIFVIGGISASAQDVPIQSGDPLFGQVAGGEEGEAVLSSVQYYFEVPEDAVQVIVSLFALDPQLDIDLQVRRGERVAVEGGEILSDYFSETIGSGSESLEILPDSQPPLEAGVHYVGVVNYETVEVSFTVLVQIEGGDPVEPTPTETPSPTSSATPTPLFTSTPTPTPTRSLVERADLDGDGRVGAGDLVLFQSVWGEKVEN